MKVELAKLVNASGFPFQLAVEHSIRQASSSHKWEPVVREHPWVDSEGEESGFIDLLLDKRNFRVVIECKRSKEAKWVFLLPRNEAPTVNSFRLNWIAGQKGYLIKVGIQDYRILPSMPESQFCIIRGSGEQGMTLLERVAALLSDSCEALIGQEALLRIAQKDFAHMYIPLITTNAELFTCVFDPGAIFLDSGFINIDEADFVKVDHICFRKTLSLSGNHVNATGDLLRDNNMAGQRSIIVASAKHINSLLSVISVEPLDAFDKMPWQLEFDKPQEASGQAL